MSQAPIDQATRIRPGEELNREALDAYLRAAVPGFGGVTALRQFPGGYSNLTYLVESAQGDFVLRRPPLGANIRSAHDMGREFRVLSLLQPVYAQIPAPVHYCESDTVIGAPFYLMRRVNGVILRASQPPSKTIATPEAMGALSAGRSTIWCCCTAWNWNNRDWRNSASPKATCSVRSKAGSGVITRRKQILCPA